MNIFNFVTLSAPWYLAAIPLGGAILFYSYLRFGKARTLLVPSLLLVPQSHRVSVGRSKLNMPLRLYLELLALALLAIALSQPSISGVGERVAVVIDNSLSMSAVDRSGSSRLKQGAELLIGRISSLNPLTRYTLFTISPGLDLVGEALSLSELKDAVDGVRATAMGVDYQSAFDSLLKRDGYDRVILLSDILPSREISNLEMITVGAVTGSNLAFKEISQNLEGKVRKIRGVVSFFIDSVASNAPTNSLALQSFKVTLRRLSGEVVLASEIKSSGAAESEFNLESEYLEAIKISIEIDNNLARDQIALDSTIFLPDVRTKPRLALLSQGSDVELGLDKLDFADVKRVADSAELNSSYDLAILHNYSGKSELGLPSLWVVGASGDSEFVERVESNLRVTHSDENHPIMKYLKGSFSLLPKAAVLKEREGTWPVVSTTLGPVLSISNYNGSRRVIAGFEIFPFGEGLRAPQSILLLNALRWLAPTLFGGASNLQRSVALAEGSANQTFVTAEGELSIVGGAFSPVVPGILKYEFFGRNMERAFFSSFPEESDLSRMSALNLSSGLFDRLKSRQSSNSSATPFLVGVILVLGLELVLSILARVRSQRRL